MLTLNSYTKPIPNLLYNYIMYLAVYNISNGI
jgi:hypothetical protein